MKPSEILHRTQVKYIFEPMKSQACLMAKAGIRREMISYYKTVLTLILLRR